MGWRMGTEASYFWSFGLGTVVLTIVSSDRSARPEGRAGTIKDSIDDQEHSKRAPGHHS